MEIRLAMMKDIKQIQQYDSHIHHSRIEVCIGAFLPPEQDADEIMYLKELIT